MSLIDTHCHLTAHDFDSDRESVIARAQAAGVSTFISIGAGYGKDSAVAAVQLARTNPSVYASVGLHPQDASIPLEMEFLEALATDPRVVAIGETGLDYFRDYAPHGAQEEWFRAQISLARRVKKPLIIHSRDSGPQCLQILLEEHAEDVGGVFHCFAEDGAFAKNLRAINFLISVPGTVTFKNAESVREMVREVPLEQIMLETDAPYLAPVPHRGKRCESAMMLETARRVAELKGISIEEVSAVTSATARRFFRLTASQ